MQGQELQQQRKSKHFFIVSVYYRSMSTLQLAELSFGSLLVHSTVGCHTADALRPATAWAFAGAETGERVFQHRCPPLWHAVLSLF
jgi:hypothetical protein